MISNCISFSKGQTTWKVPKRKGAGVGSRAFWCLKQNTSRDGLGNKSHASSGCISSRRHAFFFNHTVHDKMERNNTMMIPALNIIECERYGVLPVGIGIKKCVQLNSGQVSWASRHQKALERHKSSLHYRLENTSICAFKHRAKCWS